MTQASFQNVVHAPDLLPQTLAAVTLTIRYHSGVDPTPFQDTLADELKLLAPLFAQGFMATAPAPDLTFNVTATDTTLTIDVQKAAHTGAFLHLLLHLIHKRHQSAPDAFENLVALLQSEADARSVFVPLIFEKTVASIAITLPAADTENRVPFADNSVPRPPLHAQLQTQLISRSCIVSLFGQLDLPEAINHAFLTGDAIGLWATETSPPSIEPEIFVQGDHGDGSHLHVNDYQGHPWYLAELISTVCNHDLSRIKSVNAVDSD